MTACTENPSRRKPAGSTMRIAGRRRASGRGPGQRLARRHGNGRCGHEALLGSGEREADGAERNSDRESLVTVLRQEDERLDEPRIGQGVHVICVRDGGETSPVRGDERSCRGQFIASGVPLALSSNVGAARMSPAQGLMRASRFSMGGPGCDCPDSSHRQGQEGGYEHTGGVGGEVEGLHGPFGTCHLE